MRSKYILLAFIGIVVMSLSGTTRAFAKKDKNTFVTTRDGQFVRNGKPYRYVGTNFWYGGILGSEGQSGNRKRLKRELDLMKRCGITNVRVLVGAEGVDTLPDHIVPILQPQPGVYNDTLLVGLDYLISELEKRDMTAVLFMNNAWQWSGGFGSYLEWAGEGPVPDAADWNAYQDYHKRFMLNEKAIALSDNHIRRIVSRTNTITGKPYAESKAIMAWELCNEPRPFSRDKRSLEALAQWVEHQAKLIKSLDKNHLVTTGSEGKYGCESDMELFRRIHAYPEIDYVCIHIWPHNWTWLGPNIGKTADARAKNGADAPTRMIDNAKRETERYIDENYAAISTLHKPMVLEEFGYPRDNYAVAIGTPTTARDKYYTFVLDKLTNGNKLAGCNFWAWGGYAKPAHASWQRWDDYVGDPAFEEQGLNAVFVSDKTLEVIRQKVKGLNRVKGF